jgi:hypothetical protein
MAKAKPEHEAIATCTMGCLFFGTPFRGTNMAKLALAYSSVFGNEAYESLLEFMKAEKNDALDEVTHDFIEISNKLSPAIDILCVWEKVATSVDYSERIIPALLQQKLFKTGVKKILEVGLSAMAAGTVRLMLPKDEPRLASTNTDTSTLSSKTLRYFPGSPI